MTTRPKVDHESIRSKLDNHDVLIGHLDKRVQSVETSIKTLDSNIKTLDVKIDKVGGDVSELKNMFSEQKGKQGLGTVENIRVVAMGGSIVAMSAAAIGFLVHAYNAPTITRLETSQTAVDRSVQRRDEREQAELVALRKKDAERNEQAIATLKEAIEELKVKVGWTRVEIRR
jgi:predicted  nucleic acid-binding Zn-ribbon protein